MKNVSIFIILNSEWFHGECVCIGSQQLGENDQYICDNCKNNIDVPVDIKDYNEYKVFLYIIKRMIML